jgi:hypothetical protein
MLTIAALNHLQVKAGDIQNAYLPAPVTEKIWTRLRKEFGTDCGKKAIIVRALYRLKIAGASFRNHLAGYMQEMGYQSCKADPDVWFKLRLDPMKGSSTIHTCYAMWMTFSVYTVMLRGKSLQSISNSR